jgi:hypothetical protein
MNEEQLKKIVANIKAIRNLINEDSEGAYEISRGLDVFEQVVLDELEQIVWNNYKKENNI